MRCFRLRQRNIKTNSIIKHRDYIGLENLQKYGLEVWNRYNQWFTRKCEFRDDGSYSIKKCEPYQETYAELCEKIDGKWVKMDEVEINSILK